MSSESPPTIAFELLDLYLTYLMLLLGQSFSSLFSYQPSSGKDLTLTNMQPQTFHPFPLLPKELRMEIWKLALPDPRITELSFMCTDDPLRLPRRYRRTSRGAWSWMATATPITFPLIHINVEARAYALSTYELCGIPNQSDPTRHPMYIDFSKDTIFITREAQDRLGEVLVGNYRGVRFTNWRSKVRNLAVPLAVLRKSQYSRAALIPGPGPADPNGYEEATQYLAATIRTFPNLQDLSLVIDGRNSGFGGDVEMIEPTSEHEDYEVSEGRELASCWIPEVLEKLKMLSPDVAIPSVHVSLMTNGHDTPELERRWNYLRARCGVCHPNSADFEPEPIHPWRPIGASRFFTGDSSSMSSSSDDDPDGPAVAVEEGDGIAGSGPDSDADSQDSSTAVQRTFHCCMGRESTDEEEDGPRFAFPSLQSERSSHFRASLL
ncbi:hypothetical protein DL98DRAFT_40963 [Cadophora sp. DSE1049]|nr:hypothetical protein DL98DRAFT_40963 [Cadophora sp. DSE1049]